MKTPFKLRSGNTSSFKNLGSSPMKDSDPHKKETEEEKRIRQADEAIERGDAPKPNTKENLEYYLDYNHDRTIV